MQKEDTIVYRLGELKYDSPLKIANFIENDARVLVDVKYEKVQKQLKEFGDFITFENAGPRKRIYFDPAKTSAAIVTCGGLCPGLNTVIHTLVNQLYNQYGIKRILGVRYGYEGLNPAFGHEFLTLTPESAEDIEKEVGTILGTSRGKQDPSIMVDTIIKNNIQILFTIGGDGTLRGAQAIFKEALKRKYDLSVVGIPKTIDNDIMYIDRTFGFETAVAKATEVLNSAHAEARSAKHGIGLVKVMGRDSGFIAVYSAIACSGANLVLIPESPFQLKGAGMVLEYIHKILVQNGHAVIVVAEGAGQEFFSGERKKDASGNIKHEDIGLYLKKEIESYFAEKKFEINLKYIDPSYTIRSIPPSSDDSVSCIMFAQNAVHGAMCGRSGIVVGRWNAFFTFLPISLATTERKKVDPQSYLWSILKEATGQPDFSP